MKLGFLEKPILDSIENKKSGDEIYIQLKRLVKIFVLLKKPYLNFFETEEFIDFFATEVYIKLFCSNYKFDFKYITLWLKKVYPGYLQKYLKEFSIEKAYVSPKFREMLSKETESVLYSEYKKQQSVFSEINCSSFIENLCRTIQNLLSNSLRSTQKDVYNNSYLSALLTIARDKEVLIGIQEEDKTNVEFSIKNILNNIKSELLKYNEDFNISFSDFVDGVNLEYTGEIEKNEEN